MKKNTIANMKMVSLLSVSLGSVLFLTSCSAGQNKGLIACWKFDEGKGQKVLDSSGKGNHGAVHGATWIKRKAGTALQFDGKDDYVEMPKSASLDSPAREITMMAWIKTSGSKTNTIFERWLYGGAINERSFVLYIEDQKVGFGLHSRMHGTGAWIRSTRPAPKDKWTHVAVTSDGAVMKIYINGRHDPVPSLPPPAKIHPSAANLHIGAWYAEGKWGSHFKGAIDEVRIYSRSLTAAEILEHYRKTSPKGVVRGTVKDATGRPIDKAAVSIGLFKAVTDATGNYKVEVPADSYQIMASKKHFRRVSQSDVEVKETQSTTADFQLISDKTPPVISNLKATRVAAVTSVITWSTDKPSASRVEFGKKPGKYQRSAGDSSCVTSHRIVLPGLNPRTKYYYRISCTDLAGNVARSKEGVFETTQLGDVIIWDTNWKSPWYRPIRHIMQRKALWTQVPYGKAAEYKFTGEAMLENKFFYLFLFKSKRDCADLCAKLDTGGHCRNEIYKVYNPGGKAKKVFGKGTKYTRILTNTPEKIEVEHAGAGDVTTTYSAYANKPWLVIKAVKNVNQQGMHGETRICAFVKRGGGEFILDSKRGAEKKNYPAPEGSIGIVNFRRIFAGKYNFMWFMTFPPGAEKNPLTHLTVAKDNFFGEEISPDRPSVKAQYAYLDKKVVLGVLNHKNCWMRENVGKPIKVGESYQSDFSAPYAGKWRLIGRVGDRYYSSDVNVLKKDVSKKMFTFTSKVAGKLDYLLMYLFDRNDDTPKDIFTPMDVYQGAVLNKAL